MPQISMNPLGTKTRREQNASVSDSEDEAVNPGTDGPLILENENAD